MFEPMGDPDGKLGFLVGECFKAIQIFFLAAEECLARKNISMGRGVSTGRYSDNTATDPPSVGIGVRPNCRSRFRTETDLSFDIFRGVLPTSGRLG